MHLVRHSIIRTTCHPCPVKYSYTHLTSPTCHPSIPSIFLPDTLLPSLHPLQVPIFIDGEVRMYESLAIMHYLETYYPDPPLLPRERVAR